jgi:hypothetical protein
MMAARPPRRNAKCPPPGTNHARATVNQGERAGTAELVPVEVAGIYLILAGERVCSVERLLEDHSAGFRRCRKTLRRLTHKIDDQLAHPSKLIGFSDQVTAVTASIWRKDRCILRTQRYAS